MKAPMIGLWRLKCQTNLIFETMQSYIFKNKILDFDFPAKDQNDLHLTGGFWTGVVKFVNQLPLIPQLLHVPVIFLIPLLASSAFFCALAAAISQFCLFIRHISKIRSTLLGIHAEKTRNHKWDTT